MSEDTAVFDPMNEARKRVQAGAEFLDNHEAIPDNWRELINVNSLNIASPSNCVLGQLGPHVMGEGDRYGAMAVRLGLFIEDEDDDDYLDFATNEEGETLVKVYGFFGFGLPLTDAWREALAA